MTQQTDAALDARARRVAKRAGYSARKARGRWSLDNWGGFQLVNAHGSVVAGGRFDMTPEAVIEFCS